MTGMQTLIRFQVCTSRMCMFHFSIQPHSYLTGDRRVNPPSDKSAVDSFQLYFGHGSNTSSCFPDSFRNEKWNMHIRLVHTWNLIRVCIPVIVRMPKPATVLDMWPVFVSSPCSCGSDRDQGSPPPPPLFLLHCLILLYTKQGGWNQFRVLLPLLWPVFVHNQHRMLALLSACHLHAAV